MNRTARHETLYVKRYTKSVTYFNYKRYRPSGILIHRQNSYAPRSWRCTGRREAQSREDPPYINKRQGTEAAERRFM
jgi:hypothetical protein